MILAGRKYFEYKITFPYIITFFFFFFPEERSNSQPLIICLGLTLLLLAIGFALAIPFFIIPSYKASELFECLFHFLEVLVYVFSTFQCANMLRVIVLAVQEVVSSPFNQTGIKTFSVRLLLTFFNGRHEMREAKKQLN